MKRTVYVNALLKDEKEGKRMRIVKDVTEWNRIKTSAIEC